MPSIMAIMDPYPLVDYGLDQRRWLGMQRLGPGGLQPAEMEYRLHSSRRILFCRVS